MKKTYIVALCALLIIIAVVDAILELVVFKDDEPTQESADQTTEIDANTPGDTLTFQIAPYTQDCTGVAPMKCMVVNNELFYDDIQGFEYQEGTEYTITVKRIKRENVPADASAYIYQLIEILEEN